MHEKKEATKEDIEKNKAIAAISYIPPLFLVPLLTAAKDSPYAHFHAKQGFVLFLGEIILGVVMMIPILGWVIGILGYLLLVIFIIVGLANSLSGKMDKLPLVGDLADKFNI